MWNGYRNMVMAILDRLAVTGRDRAAISPEDAFGRWVEMATRLDRNGSIHLVGNGASASMASHYAADITKNCGIRANVFTDCALITALANDNGYENAYAVALDRYGRPGDLMVAISSSGDSPNIVNACRKAGCMGVALVTLSAKKPDNAIRSLGDLNFYVPGETFSLAESAHAVILHHWTDRLESVRGSGQS